MHYVHLDYQNNVSLEFVCVFSWNCQRILKGEDQFSKRQYVHTTTNTTATAIFTRSTSAITIAPTTASIASTCKVKSINMKISRSIWIYRLLYEKNQQYHSNS